MEILAIAIVYGIQICVTLYIASAIAEMIGMLLHLDKLMQYAKNVMIGSAVGFAIILVMVLTCLIGSPLMGGM